MNGREFSIALLLIGLFVGLGIGMSFGPSILSTQDEHGLEHIHIAIDSDGPILDEIPVMSSREAEGQGYVRITQCIRGMGFHHAMIGPDGPQQPILLFDNNGKMIGLELDSMTEQSTPPWEHRPEGHVGMEFEHWTYHEYFVDDPTRACERT